MSETLSAEELGLLSEEDIESARLVFEEELQDRLRSAKYQAMYSLAQMFKQAKAPPQRFVGISPEKLAEYQGQAATIEALQAEVTTLRTALEEAKVAAETTADLIEASHYEPAEMQAAQSAVNIALALEAELTA